MRIQILVASAAALAACGGSTAPVSSSAPDASSDVAIDHVSGQGGPSGQAIEPPKHAGGNGIYERPGQLPMMDASTGDGSSGATDAGADAPVDAGLSFACGVGPTTVMCMAPGQYCSINASGSSTNATCAQTPFGCMSNATCGCVQPFQPFDAGSTCTCAESSGHVTLTCPY